MSPGTAGAEIVAAADIDHRVGENFCMRFEISNSYSDFTELLARKDVDAVLICMPPFQKNNAGFSAHWETYLVRKADGHNFVRVPANDRCGESR